MTLSRRAMVAGAGATLALGASGRRAAAQSPRLPAAVAEPPRLPVTEPLRLPVADPELVARDEAVWREVAGRFRVSADFVNLENGYYGIMPEPVRHAYLRNVDRLNEENSHLLRTTYKNEADQIRRRIAGLLGVTAEEIALTRGGTEALQNLIAGYRGLRPGDAVMYADLDYHSAQYAMNWLAGRRGVTVERFAVPEPATRQAVLDAYERALRDHPKVRLLLLSHMNNRTGLVTPVKEIVTMARGHGVDVIVDAAHSWGHLDFTIADLDAEFAGFSLHKWMGVPLGAGFLYIRKDRLADVDPVFADETYPLTDIRSRVHSGTMNVAPILTVPTALDFHDALGAQVKQARLRYLRDRWVHQVLDLPGLEILTPEDPSMYGALTAFRLRGHTSEADNVAVADRLMSHHRVFTVRRGGVTRGDCVRVTPGLFTSVEQVDRLVVALRDVAGRMARA